MPFAVTHVLASILLIDLFRKIVLKKKDFPLYLVLIGGVAGLLPDIDFIVFWILELFTSLDTSTVHSTYTHSLVIPLVLLLIAVALWKYKKAAHVFLVTSAGYTIHLLLDALFAKKPLFFPFSSTGLGLTLVPSSMLTTVYMSIDAVLLVTWLIYEWKTKNIKDYI